MDLKTVGVAAPEGQANGKYKTRDGNDYLVWNGRRLDLWPLTPGEFDEVETHYRANVAAGVDVIDKHSERILKLPVWLRTALVDRAYEELKEADSIGDVSQLAVARWVDTLPGICFVLWLRIKRTNPEIVLEEATAIYKDLRVSIVSDAPEATVENGVPLKAIAVQGQTN